MAMSNDLDDMLTLAGQRAKEASVNRAVPFELEDMPTCDGDYAGRTNGSSVAVFPSTPPQRLSRIQTRGAEHLIHLDIDLNDLSVLFSILKRCPLGSNLDGLIDVTL